MKQNIVFILLLLFLVACVKNAQVKEEKAKKNADSSKKSVFLTEEEFRQVELYFKAKELSNRGKYADAALIYEKLLKLNDKNPRILLDASYAYFDSGNYRKSLEYALKAARFDSDFKHEIFVEIANSYDMLGESEKALEYYKKALKEKPDYNYLYLNVGVTYFRMGDMEKARMFVKKALSLDPNMAEAHVALGDIYYGDNYPIPALLAYSRYILLKHSGRISDYAFERIKSILFEGIKRENGKVNIVFNSKEPDYDGDFSPITLAFNMKKALDVEEKLIPEKEIERVSDWFNTLFALLGEMEEGQKGFVWEFYVPFFVEMQKKGYVKPFVIVLYYRQYPVAARAWFDREENSKLFREFAEWCENYKFSRPKVQVSF